MPFEFSGALHLAQQELGTTSPEVCEIVARELERAAPGGDMDQLFWVVGGVLESLQNGGLETSVALKRLLGQTDRRIKRLIDEGLDILEGCLADLLD